MIVCSGCGGRNAPDAQVCDWCSRPFTSPAVRYRPSRWQVVSGLVLLVAVVAVAVLGYLNAARPVATRAAPQTAATAPPLPTAGPTARPALAPPPAAATPDTAVASPPSGSARVGNTGGSGVQVRADPGSQARPLGVLRDGATVSLTGREQTVAARLWREVQTDDGALKGWVSADYLVPAP